MAQTLVTGGVRSGKSAWAVRYAQRFERKVFLATAEAVDDDMRKRIRDHQIERGEGWVSIEAGKNLVEAFLQIPADADCVVVDCLTVWTAHIMNDAPSQEEVLEKHVEPLMNSIAAKKSEIVLVTNEVGMGVVPEYESGRHYRDLLGKVNQKAAAVCENVILFVAGIPVIVKGVNPNES